MFGIYVVSFPWCYEQQVAAAATKSSKWQDVGIPVVSKLVCRTIRILPITTSIKR